MVSNELNTRMSNDIDALYSTFSQVTNTTQTNITETFGLLNDVDQYLRGLMSNFTSLSNQIVSAENQDNILSFILSHLDTTIQNEIESLQTQISSLQLQIHCGGGPWYRVANLNIHEQPY